LAAVSCAAPQPLGLPTPLGTEDERNAYLLGCTAKLSQGNG